jgi:hypothetical protein
VYGLAQHSDGAAGTVCPPVGVQFGNRCQVGIGVRKAAESLPSESAVPIRGPAGCPSRSVEGSQGENRSPLMQHRCAWAALAVSWRGCAVDTVRSGWFLWLVAALWTMPLSAQASRVLVPSIDFSGEDTKIHVPMSLIVDVALEPSPYAEGPEPREIMRNYQQGRDGRYDDRILPRLSEKDLAAIHRYVVWLKSRPESQVGSASQSSGQALFVPEGVSLVLRPNLAQYRGIKAVYGTLGGGPPYMPGVFVPGEGWSIPFSYKDVRPGTRAVMVIAIDHSNQKKARVLWFDLWNRSGEGRQWGPYEIHVTQAIDQNRRPFQVQSMDAVDVALNYTRGLSPAVTMVATSQPQTQLYGSRLPTGERSIAEYLAGSGGPAGAALSPEQEVTVRLWDENGNPLQQEIPVELYSLDSQNMHSRRPLSVLGPTTGRIRRGSQYFVAVPQRDFTLDPQPGDRATTWNGTPVVMRSASENGPVQFDFRRRPVVTRVLPQRQQVATRLPLGSSNRTPASPPGFPYPRIREMVVRAEPTALGQRELPIVWMQNGKPIRRSVLRPGYTTVVERFTGEANVVPKVDSAGWKVSKLQDSSSRWNSQFVALRQRGRR